MLDLLILLVVVLVSSLLFTGLSQRYALARNLLDIPNPRSSHQVLTPRGGGVAIVLSFLAGICWLVWQGHLAIPIFFGLLGAGGVVALVGLMDDHRHIPARWRLLTHFLGSAWLLVWLGPVLPGGGTGLGWGIYPLVLLYLVWLLNLYNFMDGIDGIAALEAITVCFGGAMVSLLVDAQEGGWVLPGLLAMATAGFLYWNFPAARIFMGDVGSGFLGVILGALSLLAFQEAPQLFWCWLILLGVFVVDATFTLLRRLIRCEKVYLAHRSHAYQQAARCHGSHVRVSIAVAGINLLWLLPIAVAVALEEVPGWAGLLLGYGPLLALTVYYSRVDEVTS